MAQKISLGIALLVAVLAGVFAIRPAAFHIERSRIIRAPPEDVFVQVNDFHAWAAWSPWEKLDPSMKKRFDGPENGPKSIYSWTGNGRVAEGRMTIQESEVPSKVRILLEQDKPFKAISTITFNFAAISGGTRVTWAMDSNRNFVAKVVSLFIDVDQRVGSDLERGLASLDNVAQAQVKAVAGARVGAAAATAPGQ